MPNTVSADLFASLITMVSDNYIVDSPKKLKIFQDGVSQFTQYIFLQDSLIDNSVNWNDEFESDENMLADINVLFRYAIQNLTMVFDVGHHFWNYLSNEEKIYYDYIIKEKHQNVLKPTISILEFEEMAYAKHCLALVPLQGMEWIFEAKIPFSNIEKLFTPIFHGIQMMDDIDDFTKDRISGQWNIIQYDVQTIIKNEGLINDGTIDKFEERVFYASGICKMYTEYVLKKYLQALQYSKELNLLTIESWLSNMIIEIEERIAFVDRISE